MSETLDSDEQKAKFVAPETGEKSIDDTEKLQPGEVMASVQSGDRFYVAGMLVRTKEGMVGQVVNVELIEDHSKYEDDDESIQQPRIYTNPKIVVEFVDGSKRQYGPKSRLPDPVTKSLSEKENFSQLSKIELRGHEFYLGELVSFGDGVGRLAMIMPVQSENEEVYVGIVATAAHGKGGPRFVWRVKGEDMDYIVHDEKGAIKRNPDNTLFKPTLSKES